MLTPVKTAEAPAPAFRPPVLMEAHRPRIYRRRYDPFKLLEQRIAQAHGGPAPFGRTATPFPFPLSGPLQPAPANKETSRKLFFLAKRALGLTTDEIGALLGVPFRTLQRWEQGRVLMPAAPWTLLQLVVRNADVRHLLTLRALSNLPH